MPWLTRARGALRTAASRAYGWCRPRGSWATRVATRQAQHGLAGSAATVRRWLPASGWGWKRATLVAKDDEPHRRERFARLRCAHAPVQAHAIRVVADERALHLLPKLGAAWMLQGTQEERMTPGKNDQDSLAGARPLAPGTVLSGLGSRQKNGVVRELLPLLDHPYPAQQSPRIDGVVENSCRHTAHAVAQGVASHPRCAFRWFPTDCPRAHPMARVCGAVHDKCTRHHTRKRLRDLVQDVAQPREAHGPWQSRLSQLYDAPAGLAAVEHIAAEKQAKIAA
jgi:hypothetical protein